MPPELQFWGCWPLHCVWPGAQLPEHAPLTQVEFEHVAGLPQVPLELHVWTPLPDAEHWVLPGLQTPWQAPLPQA